MNLKPMMLMSRSCMSLQLSCWLMLLLTTRTTSAFTPSTTTTTTTTNTNRQQQQSPHEPEQQQQQRPLSSSSASSSSLSKRQLESSSCDLPCQNGGYCKLQRVDPNNPFAWTLPGSLVTSAQGSKKNQTTPTALVTKAVCDCSNTNYLGQYCQIRVTPCEWTSTIVCLNGERCVLDEQSNYHCICDPSLAGTASIDGTSACQHHKTQICQVPGIPPGRSSNLFCVNDGVCNEQGGCICPAGYGGPHCEYLGDEAFMITASTQAHVPGGGGGGGANKAFVISFSIVAVVLVLVGGVLGRRYYIQRRERMARERQIVQQSLLMNGSVVVVDHSNNHNGTTNNSNNNSSSSLLIDLGPQRDFDGNELEEVEIL